MNAKEIEWKCPSCGDLNADYSPPHVEVVCGGCEAEFWVEDLQNMGRIVEAA